MKGARLALHMVTSINPSVAHLQSPQGLFYRVIGNRGAHHRFAMYEHSFLAGMRLVRSDPKWTFTPTAHRNIGE